MDPPFAGVGGAVVVDVQHACPGLCEGVGGVGSRCGLRGDGEIRHLGKELVWGDGRVGGGLTVWCHRCLGSVDGVGHRLRGVRDGEVGHLGEQLIWRRHRSLRGTLLVWSHGRSPLSVLSLGLR
jgi:hypothetical protein